MGIDDHITQTWFYRSTEEILDIIAAAIAKCGKNDKKIAREMNALLGTGAFFTEHFVSRLRWSEIPVTDYSDNERRGYWVATFDAPFCVVTGDWELLFHRVRLARELLALTKSKASSAEPARELAAQGA